MFNSCINFNQPIGSWDLSSVTDISGMFQSASLFNQNISSWNTTNVTNMNGVFANAVVFEQNLSSWNISNVTTMFNMFGNISLSTTNYDALLVGWAAQTVQPDVTFDGGNSFYNAFPNPAASAHSTLTSGPNNWIITDLGPI